MADPAWDNVAHLLHFNGTDASTTFTDEKGTTWTANGDAQIDTAQSKFGGAAGLFDGTGDYVTATYNTTDDDWWTDDYTLECWVRAASWAGWSAVPSYHQPRLIGNMAPSSTNNYWCFGPCSDGTLGFFYYTGAVQTLKSTDTLSVDTWHHIALTHIQSTGSIRLWLDGVEVTSGTRTGTPQSSAGESFAIGSFSGAGITGWVDDLRITKGEVLYTGTFTPPTVEFPNGPDINPITGVGSVVALPDYALLSTITGTGVVYSVRHYDLETIASSGQPLTLPIFLDTITGIGNPQTLPIYLDTISGVGNVLALPQTAGIMSVPAMFSGERIVAYHDWSSIVPEYAVINWAMEVEGSSETQRIPISSWQGTLQVDQSSFLQAVVPAAGDYLAFLLAEVGQPFVIYRIATFDGLTFEQEMARSPMAAPRTDRGSTNYTATLTGYESQFTTLTNPQPDTTRTLTGLRSISTTSNTKRVRADIDWFLKPGQNCIADGDEFTVSYINYIVSGNEAYMDVGQSAL